MSLLPVSGYTKKKTRFIYSTNLSDIESVYYFGQFID